MKHPGPSRSCCKLSRLIWCSVWPKSAVRILQQCLRPFTACFGHCSVLGMELRALHMLRCALPLSHIQALLHPSLYCLHRTMRVTKAGIHFVCLWHFNVKDDEAQLMGQVQCSVSPPLSFPLLLPPSNPFTSLSLFVFSLPPSLQSLSLSHTHTSTVSFSLSPFLPPSYFYWSTAIAFYLHTI